MKQVPNNEQCKRLLEKHKINPFATEAAFQALIREAYRLGRDADMMRIKYKEEVKNAEAKS